VSEAFYRLLFSSQTKVLGRQLPPLSLWHLALLEGIGSPFVSANPGDQIDLADIQAAVRICSVRWPNHPKLKPSLRDVYHAWRYRGNKRFVRQNAQALMAHIRLHCAPPELWEQVTHEGREITAPHILSRVVGLVALGIDYARIWNDIPPGMSLYLLNAAAEREGAHVRFVRPEDSEQLPDAPKTEQEIREQMSRDKIPAAQIERFIKKWKEGGKR
jgi:hypothetical protein